MLVYIDHLATVFSTTMQSIMSLLPSVLKEHVQLVAYICSYSMISSHGGMGNREALVMVLTSLFPQSLPEKSVVLFHACAHNPTGVDPKVNHWLYHCWTKVW